MNPYAVAYEVLKMVQQGVATDALWAHYQTDEAAGQSWEESQRKTKELARANIDLAAQA